jgi:site-specific recombinase XerD
MLHVVVRHQPPCKQKDPAYRRCDCPKQVHGVPEGGGAMVRQSAKTRSWASAEKFARKLDKESMNRKLGILPEQKPKSMEIKDAVDQFLQSKQKANASQATIENYSLVLKDQLLTWCTKSGLSYLDQLTSEALMTVDELWTNGRRMHANGDKKGNASSTARIKYTRVSSFFNYWIKRGVLTQHPLKMAFDRPKLKDEDVRETQPLEQDALKKLIDRTYFPIPGQKHGAVHRIKQRALLLLMRYSGLSIVDALKFPRAKLGPNSALPEGAVELRRTKTGKAVFVLLPNRVAELLRSLPNPNPMFFFWDGVVDNEILTDNWRQSLKRLAQLAGVEGFHPHRMRCTFAVEQLLRGTHIEDVAEMLGNTPEVCARHYAPLARQRRERLGMLSKQGWDDEMVWQEPVPGEVQTVQ